MNHHSSTRVVLTLALAATGGVGLAAPAGAQPAQVSHSPSGQDRNSVQRLHGVQQLHGHPGQLLGSEPLDRSLWPEGTAAAYRLRYLSTDRQGHLKEVTGSVYIPAAPYQGKNAGQGRPVVSWAHETSGVADNCAPSVMGQLTRARGVIGALLGKGYLVVSSDYEGLGGPGEHPFLVGESEAHGVVDIVRAVQHVRDAHASREWMVAGHSQGGQAALFTGDIAARYGRGLTFRGTFASAPITNWRMTFTQVKPLDPQMPGSPFFPFILSGLDTVEPNLFDESSILTPRGRELYQAARTNTCYPTLAPTIRAGKNADFFHLDAAQSAALTDAMERYAEVPIAKYSQPVFIAQGTSDVTVYPLASQATATRLKEAGTDVTFKFYPGAEHGPVVEASLADLLAFAQQRLDG